MSEQIISALKGLDPTNADHWTTDGMPRLDVIKSIAGVALTRADIAKVAPNFTRGNPVLDEPEVQNEVEAETQTADDTQATQKVPAPNATEGGEKQVDNSADEKVEAELIAAQEQMNAAKKRLDKAQAEMDVVIRKQDEARSHRTNAEDIKAFQKAQAAQRERDNKARQMLAQLERNR